MSKQPSLIKLFTLALAIAVFSLAAESAKAAATIVIQNSDAQGVGFNDPTPVSPVGNNTGTTLGQQRLNAFQFAANIWGATLNSSVTITIKASWANLPCSASTGTLGQAGADAIFANFPNAPKLKTWYPSALADALSGSDRAPNSPDIDATFNLRVGTSGCLADPNANPPAPPPKFYLGLDNNFGADIDLVSVLMHEFAHGLGFQTFTDTKTGAQASGSSGSFPSIYDYFLQDRPTGKTWDAMTDAERQASAISVNNLVWVGPQSEADARSVLGAARLRVNAPSSIAGLYVAGGPGFSSDVRSHPLAKASNGNSIQVTGNVVAASPADACTPVTNGGALAGNIALIDRGTCNFTVKVKNAQNAGAIAVVIVNVTGSNQTVDVMGGTDSTIAIPSALLSQNDGGILKSQLGSGLNASINFDTSIPPGADPQSRVQIYAPNPLAQGSSVSHWDTSPFPDLLMEPNISADIVHSVAVPYDLTLDELRDVGWQANPIGDNAFFVRQQYFDFLNRQPDSSGYAFWTNDIFNCGVDQGCAEVHRINVSAAFFLSIEFQQTGNLVYKMWKTGFGNVPGTPVAVRRANFLRDTQTVQSSPNQIIVGQGNWQADLEANKQAFALSFVQRAGFPNQSDAASFVDNLFANAGVTPGGNDRQNAINAFNGVGGGNAGRAAALRSVCDSASVSNALFNESFVLMQYFGYLQRDPDAQTPADYSGFQFWLNKLNSFNGNYIAAEMVKAFMNSDEYKHRFGS